MAIDLGFALVVGFLAIFFSVLVKILGFPDQI
jgi:hypothetical protein